MKKRAAAKKPGARKSAAKSSTKASKVQKAVRTQEGTTATPGKYTPTPIQGIGWAPFRYPA